MLLPSLENTLWNVETNKNKKTNNIRMRKYLSVVVEWS